MRLRSALTSWQPEWPLEFPGVVPAPSTVDLARDNAQRNPQRTASTASALMIGLALVTLVAVLAAGITSSFRGAVNDLWTAPTTPSRPRTTSRRSRSRPATRRRRRRASTAVANVRAGDAQVFGKTIQATGLEPGGRRDLQPRLGRGLGRACIADARRRTGRSSTRTTPKSHHLKVGSRLRASFRRAATTLPLEVRGIFDPPTGGSPFGRVTISDAAWDRFYDEPAEPLLVRADARRRDATPTRPRSSSQLATFPNAKVQTKQEFIDNQIAGLNAILNILYVLLALSVIVSLFGIVNTLVLTVFERTRELGMLRAIGMTRRQVRRMIRQESVITALIGGTIGIALGHRARRAARRARRLHRVLAAGRPADRLRDRGDRRRHPRGDLPGPARRRG